MLDFTRRGLFATLIAAPLAKLFGRKRRQKTLLERLTEQGQSLKNRWVTAEIWAKSQSVVPADTFRRMALTADGYGHMTNGERCFQNMDGYRFRKVGECRHGVTIEEERRVFNG